MLYIYRNVLHVSVCTIQTDRLRLETESIVRELMSKQVVST